MLFWECFPKTGKFNSPAIFTETYNSFTCYKNFILNTCMSSGLELLHTPAKHLGKSSIAQNRPGPVKIAKQGKAFRIVNLKALLILNKDLVIANQFNEFNRKMANTLNSRF